ncbi:hypothetical protein PC117_g17351 [Phytophthora cactorum]|uniref:Uncharacterized protein n=1 Tax=Phytophthora cactorum TaxID=29920 RepID=A0A8T1CAR2_9STRA|nr:hypothetical protein PC117_g17351 [Phytophthora cactorum]
MLSGPLQLRPLPTAPSFWTAGDLLGKWLNRVVRNDLGLSSSRSDCSDGCEEDNMEIHAYGLDFPMECVGSGEMYNGERFRGR